jgi:hypothetical protein
MPSNGNLHVTSREQGSTRVLSVTGQVDVATVDTLSGGIRDARAKASGCRLVVIPGTGVVRRLLERTKAGTRLTIAT